MLALGSHSDDIEIGCGATILSLTEAHPEVQVTWVVLSAEGQRADEARASAEAFLRAAGDRSDVMVYGFRDGYFPYVGGEVKDVFEDLKSRLEPDLILTHSRHDLHQDHRLVCELTWNTWRDHLVFEYEIPKYEGDLGRPNCYVPVPPELAERKLKTLFEVYASQGGKPWFDAEALRGLLRLRGVECRATYAEAFHARKLVLGA